jgi:ribosomal-protein-alanine N-acetyltransferase
MAVQILDAQPHHLPQIEELEQQCFSIPWTWDQLMSQLPDDCHEFLAAEQEGKVLGYVGMMTVLDEGYISNVAVDPAFRRQGIADRLITELLDRARIRELSFVTLEVREHNEPAIALYRKHGFAPVGLRKNYYELPVENALLMTKYLK